LECLTYRVCDVCFDLYFGGELIPVAERLFTATSRRVRIDDGVSELVFG
jgi:hypothetical protein